MSPVLKQIGLEGYRLIRIESKPLEQVITLEPKRRPAACPCCAASSLRSKGRYLRQVRHLDCLGLPSMLRIHCRRFSCKGCGHSFVQPLPGVLPGRHSSEPVREQIYKEHHNGICASTLSSVRKIGEATVARIYAQFTQRKARERISLDCPQVLGIDEHTVHKQQRFATTFCDLKNHRIFDVVQGKSEADLEAFLSRLRGKDRVRLVCIDLSSSYRSLIKKHFPAALIVADRFHVMRLVMHHLLKLARDLVPQLAYKRPWLRLMRTRPENLKTEQLLELQALLASQPALAAINDILQRLCNLLRIKHQKKSECRAHVRELLALIAQLTSSGLAQAQTLADTLSSWREEIARMWRFTRNNGITEGFHRKMKLIQRRAYGFRNFDNYRLRVIAQCG
jgi:transposase